MGNIEIHDGSILYFIGEKYKESSNFRINLPITPKKRGSSVIRCNSKYFKTNIHCNALLIHNHFIKDLIPYFVGYQKYDWRL